MRIAVGIEYDGTAYAGWQSQANADSIQSQVERSLSEVANHPVDVTCAGRTDAGVHALCQVAHFDATAVRSSRGWVLGANTHLPDDVSLLWAIPVPGDFHARYSATARSYRYVILNRGTRSALVRVRACLVLRNLDVNAMQVAGQFLVGEHDFTSFRSAECQSRTPVRRVESVRVTRDGEFVIIDVTANAFLHHMVRNFAGALLSVGLGEATAEWIGELVKLRDRARAGVTAPPQGLYLRAIVYPSTLNLPGTIAAEPGLSRMIRPHVMV